MPLRNLDAAGDLAEREIAAFSPDAIPRTTRAKSMDTVSSMASISHYKSVLLTLTRSTSTSRCSQRPPAWHSRAKMFVIGAAVAGLQALATACRLGANGFATDVRTEVNEQIESVGAKYVGIELDGGDERLERFRGVVLFVSFEVVAHRARRGAPLQRSLSQGKVVPCPTIVLLPRNTAIPRRTIRAS